jgi:hypothetical protein
VDRIVKIGHENEKKKEDVVDLGLDSNKNSIDGSVHITIKEKPSDLESISESQKLVMNENKF